MLIYIIIVPPCAAVNESFIDPNQSQETSQSAIYNDFRSKVDIYFVLNWNKRNGYDKGVWFYNWFFIGKGNV